MRYRLPIRPRSALREFLRSEAAGGVLLIGAAVGALVVANSPLAHLYFDVLHVETGPVLSHKLGPMTVHLWINDGLMSVFFLLVGLEIKRELLDGHLSSWADRRLPLIAATAGMAVPALVYLGIAGGQADLLRGWAIPAATDIAFALGLLGLLGARAPASLKLFLTTVAIVDDVGAVGIIALFYTDAIDLPALAASLGILGTMFAMNRAGVKSALPYGVAFGLLWYAMFLSGIHATVAGVLAAMAVPVMPTPAAPDAEDSTLHRMEHALQPWVAYAIIPLFGFANAGVALGGDASLFDTLPMAVMLGLFMGKQIGIFGSVWLAARYKIAARPAGASWLQVYGVALLCGIGFTMSLFIGGLAFAGGVRGDAVKIGVLSGSFLSAIAGLAVLRFAKAREVR